VTGQLIVSAGGYRVHCCTDSHLSRIDTMSDTKYNGWANYATWRVNLEIFDGMSPHDVTGRSLPTVSDLRHALQEWAEQIIEASSPEGLARDYAYAFLSDVDWWEIANNMLSIDEALEEFYEETDNA
jgi:hypothetical protein